MRSRFFIWFFLFLLIFGWSLFSMQFLVPVQAQESVPTPTPIGGSPHQTHDCLGCHSNPNMRGQFKDGTTVSLYYDPQSHEGSTHFEGCAGCHDAQQEYPHKVTQQKSCEICHSQIFGSELNQDDVYFPLDGYADQRAISIEVNQSCKKCHAEKFEEITDSSHMRIFTEGNRLAPLCVDCHGSHKIVSPNEPRTNVVQLCSKCHLSVYTTYESSVHGAALEVDSNPDVPTCTSCHGSHKVTGPDDAAFRADSILTCGGCHADQELMEKYDISTAVFQTYLDDFHGRTVDFSRRTHVSNITKATCYDCHGVHNIQKPSSELSTVYPSNLQKTCQQCHPNTSIRFPQAWLSHYAPTWGDTPALYAVITFYRFFVPTVIGGFVIYISLDARRRIAEKLRKQKLKEIEKSESTKSSEPKEQPDGYEQN